MIVIFLKIKSWNVEISTFLLIIIQSIMIYQNFLQDRPKSDVIFYRAFLQLKSESKQHAFFKALLAIGLISLIIINIIQDQPSLDLMQVIVGCLFVSIFGFAVKLYQVLSIYSSSIIFLAIAEAKGHTTPQEMTRNFNNFDDCVNQRVFIANTQLKEADLDEPTKKTYLRAAVKAISMDLALIFRGVQSCERFHSAACIVSIIYGIIVLTDPNINQLNKISLAIYVSLVGVSQILFLIVLLIVCLVPLICIIFLLYYCCCRKVRGDNINVAEKGATMQDIVNVGGDCSVCYQNIAENQKIYVLPCSNHHLFHKSCLENWIKIKQTCPICRAEIPMRKGPLVPQGQPNA